jgi:hypothetical protein
VVAPLQVTALEPEYEVTVKPLASMAVNVRLNGEPAVVLVVEGVTRSAATVPATLNAALSPAVRVPEVARS